MHTLSFKHMIMSLWASIHSSLTRHKHTYFVKGNFELLQFDGFCDSPYPSSSNLSSLIAVVIRRNDTTTASGKRAQTTRHPHNHPTSRVGQSVSAQVDGSPNKSAPAVTQSRYRD